MATSSTLCVTMYCRSLLTKISHTQCATNVTTINHCAPRRMTACSHSELPTYNLALKRYPARCSTLRARSCVQGGPPLGSVNQWCAPQISSGHA